MNGYQETETETNHEGRSIQVYICSTGCSNNGRTHSFSNRGERQKATQTEISTMSKGCQTNPNVSTHGIEAVTEPARTSKTVQRRCP